MRANRRHGFTMVEILVAVAILTVVVAGVMESFVVQNRAYTVVDQTTESQQNLRAIAHLLERDLRMTGFMVDEAASACGIDATNAADTLYVTDATAIDPANQAAANLGVPVIGYGGSVNEYPLALQNVPPSPVLDGQPFYDAINSDGIPDSDFQVGAGAILYDRNDPNRGTACGVVTHVSASSVRVDFENAIGSVGGQQLVLVPAHRYAVDANGALTRDGQPLANDVDDLQVAYFIDANGDGQVTTADEYEGSAGATAAYTSAGTDHSNLREIRFNLVLRSRTNDAEYSEGTDQPTENRAGSGLADGFRRRAFTTTVRPRNIGFRGV
ncbi:MAG: hypothetical protein DCC71_08885 [Proteobacteria bacterium]|nr:MAG: hypothetical protein DCC71_08885 [Pseudomonadota bacterium]